MTARNPASHQQGLTLSDFDHHAALERLGGDRRVLLSLLHHLLTDHAAIGLSLEQALAAGQPEDALGLSHTLAGAAGNLGLITLHTAARAVVTAIRHGESPRDAIATLSDYMDHLLEHWHDLATVLDCNPPEDPPRLPRSAVLGSATRDHGISPPPETLGKLYLSLGDRDFSSVDLYADLRDWLLDVHPDLVDPLDRHMDLLNFKEAHSLIAPLCRDRATVTS